MTHHLDLKTEWLEADGLGGFASGTVGGRRTRRYHALLLTAMNPPTSRVVLVNGFDAWIETSNGVFAISSQYYGRDVVHPDGEKRLKSFQRDPWPTWRFHLEDDTRVEQDIFVPKHLPLVAVRWRLQDAKQSASLTVRPFLSGRDYHSLHQRNPVFRTDAHVEGERVKWHPYADLPEIAAFSNGDYRHEPVWYERFVYEQERARGLDCTEDLVSPGLFCWDLQREEAVFVLTLAGEQLPGFSSDAPTTTSVEQLRAKEFDRRSQFRTPLHRSADAYLVRRGEGQTIVAGYPWFTDWGRDTFISIRGLCLAADRLEAGRDILIQWARSESDGMLPNRFPDNGEVAEFNSVDASLWFVIAVHDFLDRARSCERQIIGPSDQAVLWSAVEEILSGYARGTRHGIGLDDDGLLAAGEHGVQLTWMDAKVGDWVVTPRVGKPVEVQALWLNALSIGSQNSKRWGKLFAQGSESFGHRFWNEAGGYLYDVVDCEHRPGVVDAAFRANQILAVGGLPQCLLDQDRAAKVVEAVQARLWTPLGLRTLARGEPGYAGRYEGGVLERDRAYHQGTAWPWLIGPFVEAWLRAHGATPSTRTEAEIRFLTPLRKHLESAGSGHISEIADGDPPHTPRGCPFQAWSLAEFMRVSELVRRS